MSPSGNNIAIGGPSGSSSTSDSNGTDSAAAAALAANAAAAPTAASAAAASGGSDLLAPYQAALFKKQTYPQMKDWLKRLDPTFGEIDRRAQLEKLAKRSAGYGRSTQWKILKCWSSSDPDELAGMSSLKGLDFLCTVRGLGGGSKTKSDALAKLIAFSQPGDARAIEELGAGASCDMEFTDSDALRLLLTAGHSSNKDHIAALVRAKSTGGDKYSIEEWLDAHSDWTEITIMFLKKGFQPPNPLRNIINKSGYEYRPIDDQVLNVGTCDEVQQELDELDPSVSKWAVDDPRQLPRPVLKRRVRETQMFFSRILTEARTMETRTAVDRVGTWWQKTRHSVDRVTYAIFFHFPEYEHLQHCRPSRNRPSYYKIKPVLRMPCHHANHRKARKGIDTDNDDDDDDDDDIGDDDDDNASANGTPAAGSKRARASSTARRDLTRTFSTTPWVAGAEAQARQVAEYEAANRRQTKRRRAEENARRAEDAIRRSEDAAKFEQFGEHMEMAFSVLGDRVEAGLLAVGEGLKALARAYTAANR